MMNIMAGEEQIKSEKDKVPEWTASERIVEGASYYGLGWGANTVISATIADLADTGRDNWPTRAVESVVKAAKGFAERGVRDEGFREAQDAMFGAANANEEGIQTAVDGVLSKLNDLDDDLVETLKEHAQQGQYSQFWSALTNNASNEQIAENLGISADQIDDFRSNMIQQEAAGQSFATVATFLCLTGGGFAVMPVMKAIDEHKPQLARWTDEHIVDPVMHITGNAPSTGLEKQQLKQKREARYHYVEEHEEKQSWGSLLTGRLMSLVPAISIHLSWWQPNNVIKTAGRMAAGDDFADADPNKGFGGMNHYLTKAGNTIGEAAYRGPVEDIANNLAPEDKGGKEWLQSYSKLLSADLFYSFVTAFGTEKFSKMLMGDGEKGKPVADKGGEMPDAPAASISADESRYQSTRLDRECANMERMYMVNSESDTEPPRNGNIREPIHEGALVRQTEQEMARV